jgi:hypothetical protein
LLPWDVMRTNSLARAWLATFKSCTQGRGHAYQMLQHTAHDRHTTAHPVLAPPTILTFQAAASQMLPHTAHDQHTTALPLLASPHPPDLPGCCFLPCCPVLESLVHCPAASPQQVVAFAGAPHTIGRTAAAAPAFCGCAGAPTAPRLQRGHNNDMRTRMKAIIRHFRPAVVHSSLWIHFDCIAAVLCGLIAMFAVFMDR